MEGHENLFQFVLMMEFLLKVIPTQLSLLSLKGGRNFPY